MSNQVKGRDLLVPSQLELLCADQPDSRLALNEDGLDAIYWPNAISPSLAQSWMNELLQSINWTQDTVTVYGKRHLAPRLSCWMGDEWMSYGYSNNVMSPEPWQPLPGQIKRVVEEFLGVAFNSVLINYYRDGQDSNGWHSDDEPELGSDPTIASLSLGAARDFYFRKKSEHSKKIKLNLTHGSLLLMRGKTQLSWQHHVPKRAAAGPRINLTFRTIVKSR